MSFTSKATLRIPDKHDHSWKEKAKCRDIPYEEAMVLFFPEKGHATRDGKTFCCGRPATEKRAAIPECPVRYECLAYAMSFEPDGLVGVWGGTAQHERRRLYAEMSTAEGERVGTYRNLGVLPEIVELVRFVNRGG